MYLHCLPGYYQLHEKLFCGADCHWTNFAHIPPTTCHLQTEDGGQVTQNATQVHQEVGQFGELDVGGSDGAHSAATVDGW